MQYLTYLLLFVSSFFVIPIIGQNIRLDNTSFEGEPQDATMPQRWYAVEKGTTPDIMPGPWGVYLEPADGETYIGLITREDGSFESIGQRLKIPLKAKDCYSFSIDLAHSKAYANYNLPIRLRIWGSENRYSKDQLLTESAVIKHTDWKNYKFQFLTKKEYPYIIFEAYYMKGMFTPYKGNILIDNVSVFKRCPKA